MRIYTRHGDDGTTELRSGGRVRKDDALVELTGAVDEAQAALGLARAECEPASELDELLVRLERTLWVLMAELSTATADRAQLVPGQTAVTAEMVVELEREIDRSLEGLELERAFVLPGGSRLAATLDFARTVVRRAERLAAAQQLDGSAAMAYLNRLSDLCWALARRHETTRLVAGGRSRRRGGAEKIEEVP